MLSRAWARISWDAVLYEFSGKNKTPWKIFGDQCVCNCPMGRSQSFAEFSVQSKTPRTIGAFSLSKKSFSGVSTPVTAPTAAVKSYCGIPSPSSSILTQAQAPNPSPNGGGAIFRGLRCTARPLCFTSFSISPPRGESPEPLVRSYRSVFDFRLFDRLNPPSDRSEGGI